MVLLGFARNYLAVETERIARVALAGREPLVETRPPSLRVVRGRRELGAGGAAPCGEVEALGVETDRAPGRAQGVVPSEPRELGLA